MRRRGGAGREAHGDQLSGVEGGVRGIAADARRRRRGETRGECREKIARDGVRAPMISINQTLYVYSDKGKLSALKLDNL